MSEVEVQEVEVQLSGCSIVSPDGRWEAIVTAYGDEVDNAGLVIARVGELDVAPYMPVPVKSLGWSPGGRFVIRHEDDVVAVWTVSNPRQVPHVFGQNGQWLANHVHNECTWSANDQYMVHTNLLRKGVELQVWRMDAEQGLHTIVFRHRVTDTCMPNFVHMDMLRLLYTYTRGRQSEEDWFGTVGEDDGWRFIRSSHTGSSDTGRNIVELYSLQTRDKIVRRRGSRKWYIPCRGGRRYQLQLTHTETRRLCTSWWSLDRKYVILEFHGSYEGKHCKYLAKCLVFAAPDWRVVARYELDHFIVSQMSRTHSWSPESDVFVYTERRCDGVLRKCTIEVSPVVRWLDWSRKAARLSAKICDRLQHHG